MTHRPVVALRKLIEVALPLGYRPAEAGDERHEVAVDVDLVGVLRQRSTEHVEGAALGGVTEVVEHHERRCVATEDRPGTKARVLRVRHHLLDRGDDVARGGPAHVLGRALLAARPGVAR